MGQIKVEKNVGGIEGLCVIDPAVHGDARGYFMETYNEKDMKEADIDIHFVQDNQSMSTKGVLRGLHFQKQYPQCKLVRAVRGTVFDVAVDLRSNSETYGKWYGVTLSAENKKQFLIPEGFAHGFLVLSDEAEFCYKVNDFWHPNDEGGMAWNDPEIGIEWPELKGEYKGSASAEGYTLEDGTALNLSDKDQKWLGLKDILNFKNTGVGKMQRENAVQHVFLVGAKSLGAYGGYETFVYKLTEYHQNKKNIKYHVACKANGDGYMDETKVDGVTRINDHEFEFHNAHCFKIDIPQIGPAQAIYYDVAALKACCKYIKEHRIKHPIVYIMACRIGPFAGHFYKEIHKLGGTVYLNPDGHEWMRAKWSAPIRKYWKISEQMMVKYCDLAICDSVNIEKYIHECYDGKGIKGRNPKTTFIAYGADLTLSKLADDDEKLMNWYREKGLTKKDYYLVVGRFVPENSFEVMIREFMKSKSKKNFAIITNVNEKFLNELEEKLHFKSDKRIKFVGTVYDQELLKKIRENAYAYFHGHTVGGTNPSLIEALGSTDLNLLVDVGFNKEVAEDCALYWSRKPGSLAKLVDKTDQMNADEIAEMGRKAKKRVAEEYTWDKICGQYEDVFVGK